MAFHGLYDSFIQCHFTLEETLRTNGKLPDDGPPYFQQQGSPPSKIRENSFHKNDVFTLREFYNLLGL